MLFWRMSTCGSLRAGVSDRFLFRTCSTRLVEIMPRLAGVSVRRQVHRACPVDGMRPAKRYAGMAGKYLARMHPGGGNVDRAAMWLRRHGKQFVYGLPFIY